MANDSMSGLRVFDASMGVSGPYATYLMALCDAEVIKVEPVTGDWGRKIGKQVAGIGAVYLTYNRGKSSLAIDLKSERGLAAARKLALSCDILVENFRPGVMRRLGLDYESLAAERKDLIYLSISGFGPNGPYAQRPVLDTVIQAFSGWLDLNRDESGAPVLMDHAPIDVLTGLYGFQAVQAALLRRFRFGGGAHVEVSLAQAATAFLAPKLAETALSNESGRSTPGIPTGLFAAKDGVIAMAIMEDSEFARLCDALDCPDMAADPRFASRAARSANRMSVECAVKDALATRSAIEWEERLHRSNLVATRVLTIPEFLADPHTNEAGLVTSLDQPGLGPAPLCAVPGLTLGDRSPAAAPSLGEHGECVLEGIGYSRGEIDLLIRDGVIVVASAAEAA